MIPPVNFLYHFILTRGDRTGTRLISVPDDEAIRDFVRQNKLATN